MVRGARRGTEKHERAGANVKTTLNSISHPEGSNWKNWKRNVSRNSASTSTKPVVLSLKVILYAVVVLAFATPDPCEVSWDGSEGGQTRLIRGLRLRLMGGEGGEGGLTCLPK